MLLKKNISLILYVLISRSPAILEIGQYFNWRGRIIKSGRGIFLMGEMIIKLRWETKSTAQKY